jgi:hypothetical protein
MLISCEDCGRNISSLSGHCIFCGWPTKYSSNDAIANKFNAVTPLHKDLVVDQKAVSNFIKNLLQNQN